ncbi:MAG TPA: serine hydrolase domain-containing protein [Candidatus Sulfotelmatobacter sp.]|nr:serine hydrolase domain-containing protein [Candidatus Sulfotelmatobacter sp.]
MTNSLSRFLYRCLVQLHPPAFRRQFAPEMLWIFDEVADHEARIELFTDAFTSLARQWVVRWAIQNLLIGEFRFAPLPADGPGRFAWERIEFDDRPLPAPRVIQGGVVSFAFFTCIALAAFHATTVRRAFVIGNGSSMSGLPSASGTASAGSGDYDGREPATIAAVAAENQPQQQQSSPERDPRPSKIPDTPAGRQFFAWLDAFDSGDKTKLQQFLKDHYPTRSDASAIDMEMQFRDQTGGFDFEDFDRDESSTTKFVGIVKERASDQFARFVIEVDPAATQHVTSLALNMVPRPAKFALPRMTERDALAAFREKLQQEAAAGRFSGAALVAKNGTPIFTSAYGMADRDKKIPNSLTTKFRIGSMNKMFTATAVLQLAQAGKLKLTDAVGKYLTDYPNKNIATKVTVEQLLSHTGGTGDFFGPEFDKHRLELKTLDDYVKLYGTREPKFEPGARWEYSNYGFLLLGLVVEKASGEDYYAYVREHIFKPAGMNSTDSLPEDQPVPERSVGYTKLDGGSAWKPNTDTLPVRGTSAGGGYSTAGDLLAFAMAVQNHKLLDVQHTELLTTGHTQVAEGEKYAYGFMDKTEGGVRSFGHGGGAPGMNGELRIYPASGYAIVVLANLDPPAASRAANFIGNRLPQ